MLSTLRCAGHSFWARAVTNRPVQFRTVVLGGSQAFQWAPSPAPARSRKVFPADRRAQKWPRGCTTEANASERLEFKAETRKLLDIVAKSLYTDKEAFIRELISNASDACEKLRFLQSTHAVKNIHDDDVPLQVRLSADEKERKFVIEDTGVGMTRDELVDHLGTIAKSGSLDFLQSGDSDASKIIGQFGVGFYSTFVVADKVNVYTKTCDPEKGDQGYLWSSDGAGSFTITEVDDVPRGTKIELILKDDATEFCKASTVKKAAQKFSSYIDFPIYILEDGEEKKAVKETVPEKKVAE